MSKFFGREQELDHAMRLLSTADQGIVLDVVGVHGIGKSWFLAELIRRARALPDVQVHWLDLKLAGIGAGHRDDFGAHASDAMIRETFFRSRQIMRRFTTPNPLPQWVESTPAAPARTEPWPAFEDFRLICDSEGHLLDLVIAQNRVDTGAGAHFNNVQFHAQVNVGREAVSQFISEAQERVDEEFVNAWTEFTTNRRVLIAVDSFEEIADDEIGQWLVRMALRLPRTLLVASRVPSRYGHVPEADRLFHCELPNFTLDEVHECVREVLQTGEFAPGIAGTVLEYTDGHPGGVGLIAGLILESPACLDELTLRRTLARLPAEPNEKWADVVRLMLQAINRDGLTEAVQAAAVVRAFDEPLLAELLGLPPEDRRVGEAIEALVHYGLIQPVFKKPGQRPDLWRLPEFLRLSMNGKVRTQFTGVWRALHARAQEFYFRRLRELEDSGSDDYGSWYRYENPEWQACKSAWLYHSGQLTDPGERQKARGRFALVFFEAVWWWACYYPFDFARRLVEEWERTTAGWDAAERAPEPDGTCADPEQDLADALIFLLDHYPVGHVKTSERWEEITDRLLLVRGLCGLNRSSLRKGSATRRDLIRIEALITIFLAHAQRFGTAGRPEADRLYRYAIDLLEEDGDAWTVAWLSMERADLAAEHGQLREARELVTVAATRAREIGEPEDDWDHELLANLHRVRADIHWSEGDLRQAASHHAQAIVDAYWFQGRPQEPDLYTRQFLLEMTTRAGARMLELHSRDPQAAVDFAAEVLGRLPVDAPAGAQAMVDVLGSGDLAAVQDALMPPAPGVKELKLADSAFMRRWRRWEMQAPGPEESVSQLLGATGDD